MIKFAERLFFGAVLLGLLVGCAQSGGSLPSETASAEVVPTETAPVEVAPTETATIEVAPTETAPVETEPPNAEEPAAETEIVSYEYDTREISCDYDGQMIYGVAYIPKKDGKIPLAIYSHELGATHDAGTGYAKKLAALGIAVYTFDFRGGGVGSKSDGSTRDMSVMTEVSDLEMVIAAAREWDFVDAEKIVLIGGSQGGAVSAITAARHSDEISGLVLLYPAFVIGDDIKKSYSSLEEVPDQPSFIGWIPIGRKYVEDYWDYDVYVEIGAYKKPVLIVHGDADSLVPISYSERAADVYENADFHAIKGANHGFFGESFDKAIDFIIEYLRNIEILGR